MVANGSTSKEIGRVLQISFRTVETHRSNILHKLHARNTAELVRKFLS
jgi:DNA-binding NarL/FixJ family response regulator